MVFAKTVNALITDWTSWSTKGCALNDRFYLLPQERQQAIINAGFKVFSRNSYKNSPMNEIAQEAGISKSLLFHYFKNKKEFYLFLWDTCAKTTIEYLEDYECYEQEHLFESLRRGMEGKLEIMRRYPDMGMFAIRAFYEKDSHICAEIQDSVYQYFDYKASRTLMNLDPAQFVPGLDVPMMYREMYWASEGYLWEMAQHENMDIDQMKEDFTRLIEFWESVYLRKDLLDGRNQN